MQNDFVLPGSPVTVAGALATVPSLRRLLEAFRVHGWPVLHVIRAYRPAGSDVEVFRREALVRAPRWTPDAWITR